MDSQDALGVMDVSYRIERACERLVLDCARFHDAREFDKVAALFSEGGVFYRPLTPDVAMRGRVAILADLQKKPPDVSTMHVCTNITVEVHSATQAQGLAYFTVYVRQGLTTLGLPTPFDGTVHVGVYEDRFVETRDGWRIDERRGTIRYSIPAQA